MVLWGASVMLQVGIWNGKHLFFLCGLMKV